MYIIGDNIQEYISKTKERINNAISQNNFKDAFIIFVTSIPYLKDTQLSDFVNYYEEMISQRFVVLNVSNDTSSIST